jgi:hypothetical protein
MHRGQRLRRSPSAPPQRPERRAAADTRAERLLALQRGAGNAAVARLLEREGTLHAPASWLDDETHWGTGKATLRTLNSTQPLALIPGLTSSLPLPGLAAIQETTPDEVRTNLLYDMKGTVGKSDTRTANDFVGYARRVLQSHTDLMEIPAELDPLAPPQARKIMRPLDLMPEPSDLAGAGEDVLQVRWCALIALVKSEGKPAIRDFLRNKVTGEGWVYPRMPANTGSDLDFYRAMHAYFYTFKHVEYDDTSAKMTLMRPFGYTLKFVGPTSFDNLHRAQLKAGKQYVIDIVNPGHTMYTTMQQDFTAPLGQDEMLGDYFTFENDGTNYNQPLNVTFKAAVINVWEK